MSILERLRNPDLLAQMTMGEKLWGALVVTIIGMVVCMVALTAIMYSIKLMHLIFREKTEKAKTPDVPEAPEKPVLPTIPAEAAAILSPAAGKVTMLNAFEGASVQENDLLLLLEVDGTAYEVTAPCAGTVLSLCVHENDSVLTDAALVIFREKED